MKAMGLTPITPARETVMLLRPGMNLTNRSVPGPIFRNIASVLRMQLSGETVIRHSCASAFPPCRRAEGIALNRARYDRRRTRHVLGRKHDSESRRDHLLQMACVTSAVRNLGWIKAREVSLPEACRNL